MGEARPEIRHISSRGPLHVRAVRWLGFLHARLQSIFGLITFCDTEKQIASSELQPKQKVTVRFYFPESDMVNNSNKCIHSVIF